MPLLRMPSGVVPSLQQLQPRKMVLVQVVEPEDLTVLDQCLVVYFPAPHSFTGESQMEIHCHGSPIIVQRLFHLMSQQGVRVARPGEFSRRAFANGKLDLTQAEALMALIHAKSLKAAREAARQMQGSLSLSMQKLRQAILDLLIQVEAGLDFSDEEIDVLDSQRQCSLLSNISDQLRLLQASAVTGRQWQNGLDLVIAGRPNVGKSSLFNQLIGREKAIVSAVPGTTRDINEHGVEWSGMPFTLADTAGLRDSSEWVEMEGIRRAKERITQADGVLLLYDVRDGLAPAERQMAEEIGPDRLLLVANKMDLLTDPPSPFSLPLGESFTVLPLSCRTGEGIQQLQQQIVKLFARHDGAEEGSILLLARQREVIDRCAYTIEQARQLLQQQRSGELIALHLREALQVVGELVGETRYETFLDQLFSQFCIGK